MSHLFRCAVNREIVDSKDVRDAEVNFELNEELNESSSILLELTLQQLLCCESMISIGTNELTSKSFCDLRFLDVHKEYLAFERVENRHPVEIYLLTISGGYRLMRKCEKCTQFFAEKALMS